jgi:hypothetical protein
MAPGIRPVNYKKEESSVASQVQKEFTRGGRTVKMGKELGEETGSGRSCRCSEQERRETGLCTEKRGDWTPEQRVIKEH